MDAEIVELALEVCEVDISGDACLGGRNDWCVGLLGLFPGLRWRGASLAASAFIQPAHRIKNLADKLQEYALGASTWYLAGKP